ncbi:MAG: sigma-54 dependent transcriptional regulator [Nitrospiraceae bacterium]|nr:sigma-54 dependent transcriptional regulator [Nitrospiraceae bacterium]
MTGNILIVDDEINTLKVLSAVLRKEKYSVCTSLAAEEALAKMGEGHFDLVITDYKLPGMSGEAFLETIKKTNSGIPVVLLTAYGTIESAVNAMKKGAYTYLTKPVDLNILQSAVKGALGQRDEEGGSRPEGHEFLNIIGKSGPVREVFSVIRRVSKTDAGILILGESGTGKELAARALHYTSLRADKPFIPIDCTTIPSELMESELFGHEKGAFTGAFGVKTGLIEMAGGGTVFFDEVGDLDFSLQKKLLRFLQEKEIRKIGGKDKIQVDVRIIASTNKNLEELVASGEFRADLFYRLNVITINMPALRERKEDIELLASHFLEDFSRKYKKYIKGFDLAVLEILTNYEWPGNVRELQNIIERTVIFCPYDRVTFECLPRKFVFMNREEAQEGELMNLNGIEKRAITKALEAAAWNQSKAALLLGISRKQLSTKMKNLL